MSTWDILYIHPRVNVYKEMQRCCLLVCMFVFSELSSSVSRNALAHAILMWAQLCCQFWFCCFPFQPTAEESQLSIFFGVSCKEKSVSSPFINIHNGELRYTRLKINLNTNIHSRTCEFFFLTGRKRTACLNDYDFINFEFWCSFSFN